MGKGKTRKFIDKKNSITYDILHRSQRDPLAADEDAPQRVLVPREPVQDHKLEKKVAKKDIPGNREEEIHYGVFFDDGYDYLQHMKDTKNLGGDWERIESKNDVDDKDNKKKNGKISLPSLVFASIPEEDVGLLNKAAPVSGPRPDLDPDVVAAMEEDFDYDNPDNEIDDDFITLANADGSDMEFDEEYDDDDGQSDVSSGGGLTSIDEEDDEVGSLNGRQFTFKDEENMSRYTSYSMSSSVIERNKGLKLVDDKFDHVYAGYDDIEQGALDVDDIEGYLDPNSERLMQCVAEFEKEKTESADNVAKLMKERLKLVNYTEASDDDDDDNERELHELSVEPREREKWDCESVLSTYSTIYNHPKLIADPKRIEKIKINPKTGIPKNVLDGKPGKLTAKGLAQLDFEYEMSKGNRNGTHSVADTMKSTLSMLSIRPKNELPEERKERKKALKEYRMERKKERKANTEAFKAEKKRQEKIMINNRNNVQGNRIL